MQPLSHEQVLSRISKFYHDDLRQVAQKILQPEEKIFLVANHGSWGGFGYFIVTDERIILVHFRPVAGFLESRRKRLYYIKGTVIDTLLGGKGPWVYEPPSSPLKNNEIKSRQITTAKLDQISEIKRSDYEVTMGGKKTTLVTIAAKLISGKYIGFPSLRSINETSERWIAFYNLQDGQTVYNLLQAGPQRKSERPDIPDIADQLEKLAELHRYQVLTDEEYELAKKRLLGDQ